MALGRDNYWGYSSDLIVRLRVRWIEMAAVLPMWTHMLVYYVEGHEGHMMNEVVGKQEWRCNVRGQCFSFVMPWAQIIREFQRRADEDAFLSLPRSQHTLQYLFRVHLKVAGQSFAEDLQQVRLRPYVLLRLMLWLWDNRRDLFPRATKNRQDFF